jgi:hypothetical protein
MRNWVDEDHAEVMSPAELKAMNLKCLMNFSGRCEMKLFRNTDGAFETFLQMIWNKKLPWYENLLIWAGGVLLFVSFYALIFLAMLLGE